MCNRVRRRSQERLKQILKHSHDPIVLLNSKGEHLFLSESFERLTGYNPEEVRNIRMASKYVHEEDLTVIKEKFNKIIVEGSGEMQFRLKTKSGSWIYIELTGTNQLKNPILKAVVLNVKNITERKEADEDMRNLNETKDKLYSIIAHDLRSPLTSILNLTNLLSINFSRFDISKVEEYIKLVNSTTSHTLDLLDNILAWSGTQTGRLEFNPRKILLPHIIKEIKEIIKTSAKIKNISIETYISEDTYCFADEHLLKTILRNLVHNALKFTDEGGRICISSSTEEGILVISVSDTGTGISKEKLSTLFMNDKAATDKEKGFGLGLMLCKEFVEKHNGKIWVESEPGRGSTFKFSLPESISNN